MTQRECASVFAIVFVTLLAVGNFGCGGGHVTPPPPAITVTVSPVTATVQAGGTQTFTATVNNDPLSKGVTWTISPATGSGMLTGGTSTSVTYAAPASAASTLNVTITATSVADPSKFTSASVAITVTTAIFVGISPASAFIQVDGTVGFSASVTNDPSNGGVTWSVGGCAGGASVCGSIPNATPSTANYVAPPTSPPFGQVSVIATSVTNPTKFASALVTISPINFKSQNYPAGNAPTAVAVGDFNGDGKLDVAVADYGNPSTGDNGGVSILLGNSDGTIQPARLINAGKNPVSIAVGDFNDDGKQDLLLANFGNRSSGGNGNLTLLLGNGDGTFQPPITLTAGPEPFDLALGDFNNDGKLDFSVTDYSAGVYVSLGNGDGSFQPPVLFDTGNSPVAIVAHDFNGDGKLDLAVAGFSLASSGPASAVSIMLGNGDGTFAPPVPYPINDRGPTSIAAGDLNGDRKADLALTTFSCVVGLCGSVTSTLLGNGDGTFQPLQTVWFTKALSDSIAPFSINVADFTGSGKADLVQIGGCSNVYCSKIGSSVVVFPGNGNGTFQGPLFFSADQGPFALAIGDLNGDGKPDIVVANYGSNDITILLNATNP